MSIRLYCGLMAGSFLLIMGACSRKSQPLSTPAVEVGVSQSLAEFRKQTVENVAYGLKFDIPAQKSQPIPASETIEFTWTQNTAPLQLDFREDSTHIQRVSVNGVVIPIVFQHEHLLIAPRHLKPGPNRIQIDFIAGNSSLNRNDDYLYTLLVPDRARTVFPCFDQPDLKATFQLTLTIPANWQALTNAPVLDSTPAGLPPAGLPPAGLPAAGERKTLRFGASDLIPTYLFAFVAGKFTPVQKTLNGRAMTLLHRETDTAKIRLSLPLIFSLHDDALRFLEEYTQIPYPFQKLDFAAIPDFQYGGMEHVGAIDYKASSLFLDDGATRDQKLSRATLIAHETAHSWFGDMVTMRWFNDVWLKEVFANFMADKVTESSFPDANYDLQFVVDHFPAAYGVDRTEGANPIGQPLSNLAEAGTLYGGVIYHKAPIMMRQLERLVGKDSLRSGLREYLKTYAFGNATWTDLIRILDKRTPTDLAAWSQIWVNETGRPVFLHQYDEQNGKIREFTLTQRGEDGSGRVWPQQFEVALVYADHTDEITVDMTQPTVDLRDAIGKPAPQFVVFNATGQGYGRFPIDSAMLPNLMRLSNPVTRASAYINLSENMLAGSMVSPAQLADTYRSLLNQETEELNLRLLTNQLSDIVWHFTKPADRSALAATVEKMAWNAMELARTSGNKKLLFRLYQSIALSHDAQQRLYKIWDSQQAPAGITLTEDDYLSLALALAVRDYPAEDILTRQLARIKNPDRRKRLEFMMPALSNKSTDRDTFFASLASETNRDREAWVTAALGYLHHPLRAETSVTYLPQSLALLEEIQRTGDIFFPEQWLRSTLGAYQTPAVAALVRQFLADHPTYNPRLRAKLLQASDGVFRASRLLYGE